MRKYRNERDKTEVFTIYEVDVPLGENVSDVPLSELPVRLKIQFGPEEITLRMNAMALVEMLMGLLDDMVEMTGRKGISRMPQRSELN